MKCHPTPSRVFFSISFTSKPHRLYQVETASFSHLAMVLRLPLSFWSLARQVLILHTWLGYLIDLYLMQMEQGLSSLLLVYYVQPFTRAHVCMRVRTHTHILMPSWDSLSTSSAVNKILSLIGGGHCRHIRALLMLFAITLCFF